MSLEEALAAHTEALNLNTQAIVQLSWIISENGQVETNLAEKPAQDTNVSEELAAPKGKPPKEEAAPKEKAPRKAKVKPKPVSVVPTPAPEPAKVGAQPSPIDVAMQREEQEALAGQASMFDNPPEAGTPAPAPAPVAPVVENDGPWYQYCNGLMAQYNGHTGNPLVGAAVAKKYGVTNLRHGDEAACCAIATELEKLMNIKVSQ